VVGIMGGSIAETSALEAARRLGRLVAEAGWVVLTGGRPAGVMDAASAGAKSVPGGITLGILPDGPGGPVGGAVDIAVFTGMGEARNAINVLSSDVVVVCGAGGAGTASEAALALRLARPTVLLAPSPEAAAFYRTLDAPGALHVVETPEAAVDLIEHRIGIARWACEDSRNTHTTSEGSP
jgi:uncharacterized protein (TIGR00725 family)